ncbi:MAG TPA: hypothetical protein VHR45_25980 [Thermoanaerobaculia bacterium]|nr:hypothetical protein [Thermoanaerobaculia bacterium]
MGFQSRSRTRCLRPLALVALGAACAAGARAQERVYFITYNHQMEEPGSLEIALAPVYGTQRGGGSFLASWMELEYGVRGWWTTELYLAGQATRHDSTLYTAWRWESRFRPLLREHWINPVLYVEYEDLNGADKTMLEVVGHDVESDHAVANALSRRDRLHELETKLILSSHYEAWEIAENLIAEKNLAGGPWEFGYAIGASRPLALEARPETCTLCPENFVAGLEIYGGLGSLGQGTSFGLRDTSHYLAPLLAWALPGGTTLRLSPTFGLNGNSHRFLLRFGVSYEISGFGRRIGRLFRRGAR